MNPRDLFFNLGRAVARPVEPEIEVDPVPVAPPRSEVDELLEGTHEDPDPSWEVAEALETARQARESLARDRSDALARLDNPSPVVEFSFDENEPFDDEDRARLAASKIYWQNVKKSRWVARKLLGMDTKDEPIDPDVFWESESLPTIHAAFEKFGLQWPPYRALFVDNQ